MKGSIGTATYLSYTRPYWGKVITRLNYIDKLSPEAKVRYKDIKGVVSEWLQIYTIELNLIFTKIFLFSAVDPLSRLYYLRAYQRATSLNARDFLLRLTYLHHDRIKYLQIDNGSEWEKYFVKEVEKRKMTLVYNYPKSPKMNAFVERVNGTVQT